MTNRTYTYQHPNVLVEKITDENGGIISGTFYLDIRHGKEVYGVLGPSRLDASYLNFTKNMNGKELIEGLDFRTAYKYSYTIRSGAWTKDYHFISIDLLSFNEYKQLLSQHEEEEYPDLNDYLIEDELIEIIAINMPFKNDVKQLKTPIQQESEEQLWQELHHNYLLYKLEGLQKMLKGEALFAYVQEKLSKEFTIKRK